MPSPDYTNLVSIQHLIVDADSTANLLFTYDDVENWPNWYLKLLSQLHAVVRGKDILHLSSSVANHPNPQGEVVVFTQDVVIRARVVHPAEGGVTSPSVATSVWKRSDIVDLTVTDVDVFPELVERRERRWPRHIGLTLSYRDQPDVSLPLTTRPSTETMSSLIELVDGLFSDLVG